jgi:cytochrome c-type biogenesis protein CcmH
MEAGKTDEEIVAYLVERYGDFVTFRPPVNASTALLWFGPFIMLIIGAITLVIVLKKRAAILTSEENAS